MQVVAEMIATYMLVFVTCGSAALAASDEHKVSRLGASIAGGLVVTVMIYAVGHISGAHMNPAVTLAFAAVRHFPWKQVPTATLLRSPCSSIFVMIYAVFFSSVGIQLCVSNAMHIWRQAHGTQMI